MVLSESPQSTRRGPEHHAKNEVGKGQRNTKGAASGNKKRNMYPARRTHIPDADRREVQHVKRHYLPIMNNNQHVVKDIVDVHDSVNVAIESLVQNEGRTLPRIGYILLSGYHIFKANPLNSNVADPGFRTVPIFESVYSVTTTPDKLNFVPKGVWVRHTLSCEKSNKTRIFHTVSSSYMKQLESHLRVHANLFNFASVGMNP